MDRKPLEVVKGHNAKAILVHYAQDNQYLVEIRDIDTYELLCQTSYSDYENALKHLAAYKK